MMSCWYKLIMSCSLFTCMQIDLVNSTNAELVRTVRLVAGTMDQRDDVTQLVPSVGGDYVYALIAQQVNLMGWHYISYMTSIKLSIKHTCYKQQCADCQCINHQQKARLFAWYSTCLTWKCWSISPHVKLANFTHDLGSRCVEFFTICYHIIKSLYLCILVTALMDE